MFSVSLKAVRAVAQALVLAGIIGGVVVGCNEASSPVVGGAQVVDKNVASSATKSDELVLAMKTGETNAQLAALAKSVASTLAETNTAKAVHIQAMRRFDGCTDVLWSNLNTDQNLTSALGSSGNWTATVARNAAKFNLQDHDVRGVLEQYTRHYAANAHLYWHNAEKWDGKTAPLVTFVPVLAKGLDIDRMPSEVVAFDADGKEYIVNEAIAKTRPVVVIAPNERTEMSGQLKQAVAENLNRPRTSSPKDGALLQNSYLALNSLSFNDAFEGTWFIEHWILGDPEFYCLIHTIGTNNTSFVYQWARWDFTGSITRAMCNGQLFSIFRGSSWNSAQEKTLNFKWFEFDDSNVNIEYSLGASFKIDANTSVNASYKVTIKESDDVLGGMTAHFDDVHKQYYSGNPNMILSW